MKNIFKDAPPLYLISDRVISNLSHRDIFRIGVSEGVRVIQLREKEMTKRQIYEEAKIIREITRDTRTIFIINDHVDIAYVVGADGVHLGQDDLPLREARRILGRDKIIGISTHTLREAIDAERGGADYIGYGPIFHTTTKETKRPMGIDSLKRVRESVNIPVVAIGGITIEDSREVMDAGADAVAMISCILRGDIRKNIRSFITMSGERMSCYD